MRSRLAATGTGDGEARRPYRSHHLVVTTWLFAEGTTTTRVETYLTILNPVATPSLVTASFFNRTGASLGSLTLTVAGLSRANIKLNAYLHASGVSPVLTSAQPGVVERPEYFGSPAPMCLGGTARPGAGSSPVQCIGAACDRRGDRLRERRSGHDHNTSARPASAY